MEGAGESAGAMADDDDASFNEGALEGSAVEGREKVSVGLMA